MVTPVRLVLLLLFAVSVCQLAHTSSIDPKNIVHDDIPDNQLDLDDAISVEQEKQHVRISTPKVKEIPAPTSTSEKSRAPAVSTTTQKTVSDNLFNDLVEASKHSEALSKDERFKQLLAKKLNASSTTTEPAEDSYDDYEYDDYEYYEDATTVASKKAKNKALKLGAQLNKKSIEMKPIKEDIKTSTVKPAIDDNKENNNIEFHDDNNHVNENDEDDDDYDE
ncbi:hypothetical protein DOY81_010881, partial [Sarcophaga bullata]